MEYQPREGFDYIVDLYDLTGVPNTADDEAIRQALNTKAREYHPDRLQGLAAEFQEKGERVVRLLNRARNILLDPAKRDEYNQILADWNGPISPDGIPVISLEDRMQASLLSLSPDELDAALGKHGKAVADMVKYDPVQQGLLGRMYETAAPQELPTIRKMFDDSLLAEDQVLALEEQQRNKLLGIPTSPRYEASLNHAEKTTQAIEEARDQQSKVTSRHQIGSVSTRLALLAGETTADGTLEPVSQYSLADHFDAQAGRLYELAQKRQEVLQRRLEIFQPTYLIPEVQTIAMPNFIIGVEVPTETGPSHTWLNFAFDADARQINNSEVPSEVAQLLSRQDFAEVYNSGFNVLTFEPHEHIGLTLLLEEACNKHIQNYFSDKLVD